jgi:hypothetical protein
MRFSLSALSASLLLLAGAGPGVSASPLYGGNDTCIAPRPIPDLKGSDFRSFGVVMFRGIDMVDVFGTLDPLQLMSLSTQQMQLHLIAETLDPITTEPARMNPYNSTFWPVFPVTDTFESADELDLDVLIIPGGPGVRSPNLQAAEEFIKRTYPRVKLMLTVCTGAGLAARAGVLDGRLATTNKAAWETMTESGPKVQWVSPARYVMDGNIWSSSGVRLLPLLLLLLLSHSSPAIVGGGVKLTCGIIRSRQRWTSSLPSSRRTGAPTRRTAWRESLSTSPGRGTMIRSPMCTTFRRPRRSRVRRSKDIDPPEVRPTYPAGRTPVGPEAELRV